MSDSENLALIDIELSKQPGISYDEYEEIRLKDELSILVISDTHGKIGPAQEAISLVPHTDLILHLGDHASDLASLRSVLDRPVLAVRGNCDGFGKIMPPEILELKLAGCRIIMTHGHNRKFEVKNDLIKIRQFASNEGKFPELMLFGHTHSYHDEMIRGRDTRTRLLNPGSCSYLVSAISIKLTAGNITDVTRLTSSS